MSKIVNFGVVFENCEVLELAVKDCVLMSMSEPFSTVSGCNGSIQEFKNITELFLAIAPGAEPTGGSFLQDYSVQRLNGHDVTAFFTLKDDGTKDVYSVVWPKNSSDYVSTNQFTKEVNGSLVFTVAKGFPNFKEERVQRFLDMFH